MPVRFSLLPRLSPTRKWVWNNRCYTTKEGGGPLKILFFGRGQFSCDSFKELHDAKDIWETIDVVTTPDELIDKQRTLSKSPLKSLSEDLGVPVHFMHKDSGSLWQLPHPFETPSPTKHILISSSWGRAIPSYVLSNFPFRFNIHPSLIPKYRGAAPIQWTLANGDKEMGVSIIQMEEVGKGKGFDQGDIYATKKMTVPNGATYQILDPMLAKEGGALLVNVLRDFINGKTTRTPQDSTLATRAPLIKPLHAKVRWETWTAEKIVNRHSGFRHQQPLHTAYTNPLTSTLRHIELLDPSHPPPDFSHPRPELENPGDAIVIRSQGKEKVLAVRCADGRDVWVKNVKVENKKNPVGVGEWWNGVKVEKGGVLRFITS